MDEIKEMDLESKDLVAERIEQMKALFPEIATEGDGSIDFEKLRLILGDEVDEGDERYAFTWPGKADAIRQAQTVSTATLRPCPEKSIGWDTAQNLYIEGDNLEVLKLLQRGYHGKVKMIYIDPPYNTGHEFVYEDDFSDGVENYRAQSGLTGQSNADSSGRYHSKWCSMMYPRLKLARELLADDGVIFISIDDNEQANLANLCDEVFGSSNRIGPIIQNKANAKNDTLNVQKNHEFILVYRKAAITTGTGSTVLPTIVRKDVKYRDAYRDGSRFYYMNDPITTRGEGGTLNARPNLGYSVYFNASTGEKIAVADYDAELAKTSNDEQAVYSTDQGLVDRGFECIRPPRVRGKLGCWTWALDKFNNQFDDIVITGRPGAYAVRKRTFVNEKDCEVVDEKLQYRDEFDTNSRSIIEFSTNEGTKKLNEVLGASSVFDNPKNLEMIKYLVNLVPGDNFIVLDFFSGSATTAHAVIDINATTEKNLKFIMVQLPEPCNEDTPAFENGYKTICEVGEERIRRTLASTACGKSEGVRVLELDESGIVQPVPGQLLLDRIRASRTDQDIIFEMMLKWGLELTYPIEKISVAGYECYSIAGDVLICCMSDGLTVPVIQEIADMEPDRVLMLDSILDDTLKLNALQIFKRAEEKTQKKIDLRTV